MSVVVLRHGTLKLVEEGGQVNFEVGDRVIKSDTKKEYLVVEVQSGTLRVLEVDHSIDIANIFDDSAPINVNLKSELHETNKFEQKV